MKRTNLIILVVLMFVIGLVYVSLASSEETTEVQEVSIEEDTLDFNDSISIRQVRQMDSLHAAGKL